MRPFRTVTALRPSEPPPTSVMTLPPVPGASDHELAVGEQHERRGPIDATQIGDHLAIGTYRVPDAVRDSGFVTNAATTTYTTDGSRKIPIDSSPSSAASASATALATNAGRDNQPATTASNGTIPIA